MCEKRAKVVFEVEVEIEDGEETFKGIINFNNEEDMKEKAAAKYSEQALFPTETDIVRVEYLD
ncbi:MAG: hypothetical protein ACOCQR_03005 [bacterium]